jgi:putative ABC transport system ATP-binding protein
MAEASPGPAPNETRAGLLLVNEAEAPMVRIRGLNHYFGSGENRKQVLADNHLTLMPGELVVMTGPSGSGKTTLLTLIGALRTVQEGSVQIMGQELCGLDNLQLTSVRRGIGFIFQAHNLFDSLTAFQNVKMALELKTYTQSEMAQRATELLTRLGLGHRIHYKPRALSGGQKQRVAVARALANRPKLILADEPTAALDKVSGREVVTMFKELAKNERCTILMVTHDNRILDMADRIVNMIDGRVVSEVLVEEAVAICEFLVKCSVFEKNSPAELAEVSQKMLKVHYTPGATVIRQGDEGDKFFLIRDGQVDVLLQEGDNPPRKVDEMGPGDFFGEAALITGKPRNATIVAQDDVVLYELKKDDFLSAMNASDPFTKQLRDVFFKRSH